MEHKSKITMKNEYKGIVFEEIVNQANDAIIITTAQIEPPHPKIIYVNSAFEKLTGYKFKEVEGKSPRILQGPKSDRITLAKAKEALREGKAFRGELINYKKNKTTYVIEWHIAPIKLNGKIINWMSIQRDVTQRKNMEDELKKNREFLKSEVEIRTQNILKLKENLEIYARKLENKINSLERKITLSNNEKKVLLQIIANPSMTDAKLALDIKMKRSTFTAIKKRLEFQEWFSYHNIPNYEKLGFSVLAINRKESNPYAVTHKIIDKMSLDKNSIFRILTDENEFSINVFKTLDETNLEGDIFPLHTSKINWFNFSENIAILFNLKNSLAYHSTKTLELSKNDKKILLAMVKHPKLNPSILSQIVNLSVSTTNRTYGKLLESNYIYRRAIPNLKKLPVDILIAKDENIDGMKPFFEVNFKDKKLGVYMILGGEYADKKYHELIKPKKIQFNFSDVLE